MVSPGPFALRKGREAWPEVSLGTQQQAGMLRWCKAAPGVRRERVYWHGYISTTFALLLFIPSLQWLDGTVTLQTSWHQLKTAVATCLVVLAQDKHTPSSLNFLKIFDRLAGTGELCPARLRTLHAFSSEPSQGPLGVGEAGWRRMFCINRRDIATVILRQLL